MGITTNRPFAHFVPAARVLVVRGLGSALSYVMVLVLTRTADVATVGEFFVAMTFLTTTATLAAFGTPPLLVRELGSVTQVDDTARRQVEGALGSTMTLAAGLGFVTIAAWPLWQALLGLIQPALFILVEAVVVIEVVHQIADGSLRGVRRPVEATAINGVIPPLLFGAVLALWGAFSPESLAGWQVGLAFLGVRVVSGLVAALRLRRLDLVARPRWSRRVMGHSRWLALTTVAFLVMAQIDIPILSGLAGTADVALFGSAKRVAGLLGMPLVAVNAVIGPEIARLLSSARRPDALRLIRQTSLGLLALMAPVAALIVWLAPTVMGFFGSAYVEAGPALRVLVAGQVVNVATGPVGLALMMGHRERVVFRNVLATTAVGVLTAFLLIPSYGLVGAAIAFAGMTALANVANWVTVWFTGRAESALAAPPADHDSDQ